MGGGVNRGGGVVGASGSGGVVGASGAAAGGGGGGLSCSLVSGSDSALPIVRMQPRGLRTHDHRRTARTRSPRQCGPWYVSGRTGVFCSGRR